MNILSGIFVTILLNLAIILVPALAEQTKPPETLNTRDTLTNITIAGQTLMNDTNNQFIMRMKVDNQSLSFVSKIYKSMMRPLRNFITAPKVNAVMKNIATCVVNGAVEIISYYFPAPLIPIIASAAGMMVPFEPVLMLRDKVPVTSYRRAFMTALNSFLGTFDKYKLSNLNEDYDPYMMNRFNRRLMNYGSREGGTWKPLETTSPPTESHKGNKGDFIYSLNRLFKTLDRLRKQESSEEPTRRMNSNDRNYSSIGNN